MKAVSVSGSRENIPQPRLSHLTNTASVSVDVLTNFKERNQGGSSCHREIRSLMSNVSVVGHVTVLVCTQSAGRGEAGRLVVCWLVRSAWEQN